MSERAWKLIGAAVAAAGLSLLAAGTYLEPAEPMHPAASAGPAKCDVHVFFAPGDQPGDAIAIELRHAQPGQVVRGALYGFNDDDLVREILAAQARGVDQAYKFDKVQSAGAKQKAALARLKAAGVPWAIGHVPGGILHDKFAVFDHRVVIQGSYNWTNHARKKNRENLLVLDCPDLAAQSEKEWEMIPTE
jgi:hypothetical protein